MLVWFGMNSIASFFQVEGTVAYCVTSTALCCPADAAGTSTAAAVQASMCVGVMLLLPCQGSQPDCMWLRWHLFLVQCLVVVCLAAAVYMPVAGAGGTSTAAGMQASMRLERAAIALPGRLVWLHVRLFLVQCLFMACLAARCRTYATL